MVPLLYGTVLGFGVASGPIALKTTLLAWQHLPGAFARFSPDSEAAQLKLLFLPCFQRSMMHESISAKLDIHKVSQ